MKRNADENFGEHALLSDEEEIRGYALSLEKNNDYGETVTGDRLEDVDAFATIVARAEGLMETGPLSPDGIENLYEQFKDEGELVEHEYEGLSDQDQEYLNQVERVNAEDPLNYLDRLEE